MEPPNEAWLAGAKAGLQEIQGGRNDWVWKEFIENIQNQLEGLGIKATRPGEEPQLEHVIGSAFEALGGYVSVAGNVQPDGHSFPVHLSSYEQLESLLSGFLMKRDRKHIVIPQYDIVPFRRLVPLRGPVAEWLEEVA
jgi:hypothetical protein